RADPPGSRGHEGRPRLPSLLDHGRAGGLHVPRAGSAGRVDRPLPGRGPRRPDPAGPAADRQAQAHRHRPPPQVGAQRDLLQRLTTKALQLHPDTGMYYRDIYDHVVRQHETADSLRDLLAGTMDVYLSTVANRQNATMQQLTVVASLFLPLTFLSGFFG